MKKEKLNLKELFYHVSSTKMFIYSNKYGSFTVTVVVKINGNSLQM